MSKLQDFISPRLLRRHLCCKPLVVAGRFLDQDVGIFEKSMKLDYFGSLHVAKAVLPGMLKRGAGHLLFTASPLASIGTRHRYSVVIKALQNNYSCCFQLDSRTDGHVGLLSYPSVSMPCRHGRLLHILPTQGSSKGAGGLPKE